MYKPAKPYKHKIIEEIRTTWRTPYVSVKFNTYPVITKKFSYPEVDHTDGIGTDEYNQTLSEKRAETVKQWLVSHSFLEDSSQALGFGKRQPLAPNKVQGGHQGPTQSAPANPPNGGSSGKPASGSGQKTDK